MDQSGDLIHSSGFIVFGRLLRSTWQRAPPCEAKPRGGIVIAEQRLIFCARTNNLFNGQAVKRSQGNQMFMIAVHGVCNSVYADRRPSISC